jgi:nicotine oxidoreductase
VRDKIVQEVMRMILEAIFDSPNTPYFSDVSHGFRPNHSCHTALREIRGKWVAMNWWIEGDIRACFDELDQHTWVTILQKKIQDQRFLNLIWKLLDAGYLDLHGVKKESLMGSPQGSLVSPMLANAYLHELDEFVEGLRTKLEKGKEKRRNPAYLRLLKKKRRMAARGETKTREFKQVVTRMRALPSKQVDDPEFIRIRYLRYADDWLVGICGNHTLAEEIKSFLRDHLKRTLSEENTHIPNARTEEAFFLGTTLKMGNGGTAKVALQTTQSGKTFNRRSTGWETVMNAPLPKLLKRLSDRGFCTKTGEPTSKAGWTCLDADQIVNWYSATNRGIQNSYRFADNWAQLSRGQ